MNRKERRATGDKKKLKVYTFKEEDLQKYVENFCADHIKKIKEEVMEESINIAMTLLLVLPMEVLMDHYWKKSYAKRIPEFTEHLLDYYQRWENGELDMEEMKKDLWEYGGVRLEVEK